MSKSIKVLHHFAVLLMVTALIAGCNIFGFTSDAELSPTEKAEEAIREHDYAKAKAALSDVIYPDPDNPKKLIIKTNDSMVLYTYAKAALLASGITFIEIMDLAQNNEEASLGSDNPILAIIDKKDQDDINAWYQQNRYIQQVLKLIADGETYGEFETDDIALDLTISSLMSCMLGMRDTNQDGNIDDNDINLNFILTQRDNFEGFDFEEGKLEEIFGNDHEKQNEFIDFILSSAENSLEGILLLAGPDEEDYVVVIRDNINEAKQFLSSHRYNDVVDNDGD